MFDTIKYRVKNIVGNKEASAAAILGGIMVMIIG